MLSRGINLTVIFAQQIDQQSACIARKAGREGNFARFESRL